MIRSPLRVLQIAGLLSLGAVPVTSQQPLRSPLGAFAGTTEPTLVNGGLEPVTPLVTVSASDTVVGTLPPGAYHPGDSVFRTYVPWGKPSPLHVAIVEPRSGVATLYADLNQDRQFDSAERFQLQTGAATLDPDQWPGFSETVTLNVALPTGSYFKRIPFSLYYRPAPARRGSPLRLLLSNYVARGHVIVDGQRLPIVYSVDSETGGLQRAGFRAIGDEVTMAVEGEPEPVFRVGNRFVAIASVDPATGNVVVRERRSGSSEPEDDDGATAKRYRARLGKPLPDFTFTDRQGKPRSLADFRGKLLLIDIWALDCGPCAADLPYLREAYRRFHSKGFEILGFELRGPSHLVEGWSQERAVRWAQIDGIKLHDMLAGTWGVATTPTYILVGPDGNVLTIGTIGPYKLRGVHLWKTLEQLLPDTSSRPGQAAGTLPPTHPPISAGQDTAGPSSPIEIQRANGTLEILGLRRWTRQMLMDSLNGRGECDLRGRSSLVACVTVLQKHLGFPEAVLVSPPPTQGTGTYAILSLVEPADSARVRTRHLGSDTAQGRREWSAIRTLLHESERVYRFLVETAFYPRFDFKAGYPPGMKNHIAYTGRDSIRYDMWSDWLAKQRTPEGYDAAVRVLQQSNNKSDRRIAILIVMPFVQDTLTWSTLFNILLEQDISMRLDGANALSVLTDAGHRPRTWTAIAPAVHAILDGTNPSELHTVVALLRTLKVGPDQASLFLDDGGHMLLAFAGARHPSYNQPAFRLLRLLSGEDFGSDLQRWAEWVASVSSPTR